MCKDTTRFLGTLTPPYDGATITALIGKPSLRRGSFIINSSNNRDLSVMLDDHTTTMLQSHKPQTKKRQQDLLLCASYSPVTNVEVGEQLG